MAPPKKNAPSLSALKSMMAAKAAAEAEQRRQEEEERLRQEEEARREKEIALREEAERAARKEREQLRKEELRKQGKLQTKAEREREKKNRLKLEQLLTQAPVQVPAMAEKNSGSVDGEVAVKKKRPVYDRKKKHVKAEPQSSTTATSATQGPGGEAGEADGDVLDDWETAAISSSSSESDNSDDEPEPVNDATSPKFVVIASKPTSPKPATEDAKDVEEITKQAANLKVTPTKTTAIGTADVVTNSGELRSPICCILGHVDTGKTKLLDKIRQTNVQEGEAGGITQQIGATYFPMETIKEKTRHLVDDEFSFRIPGLLVIDTPGHESFTNLRSRGSSLCNIAILVVDIMHGLEPQTLESLGLLRQRKTPFVVALNKVDRLYGWKSPDKPQSMEETLEQQGATVRKEFNDRVTKTQVAFAEQGLNAELFWKNTDVRRCVSLVPTSAITGDGISDLLMLLVRLTQTLMAPSLLYLSERLQCTVLEVKVVEGLGTTIDVILSNGILREGDKVALCGLNGPIITTIRALLTPAPLRELRVKSPYVHHQEVKAALGVKICAPDLEKAVAGSQLLVIRPEDDEETIAEQVMADLAQILASVDRSGQGVSVQASTLGSLEALLAFLQDSKIPVSSINIGPVHKKDIVRAAAMLEQAKEYAVILAFDVRIDPAIQELADEMDVRIFRADIIYHLFDQFTAYMTSLADQRRRDLAPQVVFPCILRIVPGCVFNKRDPIILGIDVVEGILRVGTPLSAVLSDGTVLSVGRVSSIELNHRPMNEVRRGGPSVAIKIEHASYEPARLVGRHFNERDQLVSKISRASIDILKENFRNDLEREDWQLVVRLKKVFNIQ